MCVCVCVCVWIFDFSIFSIFSSSFLSAIVTGADGEMARSKPFKYTYEKEIVMYAYFKKLDYFSTECIYAPNAYR